MPYTCIIIDDEPAAIQRLQELIATFPKTFDVLATTTNAIEAVDMIQIKNPDVIFLDIQMPGLTGFELLKKLDKIPLVIFCTAFDQYALQAFETNSIDYLLKPVKKERFRQTVEKLKELKRKNDTQKIHDLLEKVAQISSKPDMSSITVRDKHRILFYKLDDIAYFQANEKYVELVLRNGERKLTDKTLISLEEGLPANFMRVHRSYIINTDYVKEVQEYFNSRYCIQLNDNNKTKIISGRSFLEKIKDWIGK